MSVWDSFRKVKNAGQRLLDRMDEVEREVRDGDVDATARRMAFQSSETELFGGVGDLGDLGMDEAVDVGIESLDLGSESDLAVEESPVEEADAGNPFFLDLKRQHVDEEHFDMTQAEVVLVTDPETTGGGQVNRAEDTDASGLESFSDRTQVGRSDDG
jgi:hypothetical protein